MNISDVDAEGRPILVQVALAGDEARQRGLFLELEGEQAPTSAASRDNPEGLEQYLRERIEQAVRKALPQATRETLDRLRRNERWYDDH